MLSTTHTTGITMMSTIGTKTLITITMKTAKFIMFLSQDLRERRDVMDPKEIRVIMVKEDTEDQREMMVLLDAQVLLERREI